MKRIVNAVAMAILSAIVANAACSASGRVALLFDPAGQGDLSFCDMAREGVGRACLDFDWEVDYYSITSPSSYQNNLQAAATHSPAYDLIICVGFLYDTALATTAAAYPNQRFAIVDCHYVTGANILNLAWRENEMAALIGALGALLAATQAYPSVGVVFGMNIPILWRFEAGLRFGVEWGSAMAAALAGTTQGIGLLYDYAGSLSNPAPCLAAAQGQIAAGAVGVYNVAGPCGSGGVLQAITTEHNNTLPFPTDLGAPYYFGNDSDEDYRAQGHFVLASSMKRVDRACYLAVQAVEDGIFTGTSGPGEGRVLRLGLKENCIGLSGLEDLRQVCQFAAYNIYDTSDTIGQWEVNRMYVLRWVWDAVHAFEEGVRTEQILVPTADDQNEIAAVRALYAAAAAPIPAVRLGQMQALGAAYKAALGSAAMSLTDLAVSIAGCLPY